METPILALRRDLLRRTQNTDGGWGYYAGKQSWMEPTAYAMLALHTDPASAEAVARAYRLVKSWQVSDGGWKPAAQVPDATWVTALGVTLCTVQGDYNGSYDAGLRWLLRTAGAESDFIERMKARLAGWARDSSNRGWPWRPATTAWVEPTVHSLIALRRAAAHSSSRDIATRIHEGEQLLLTVRAKDGGWNYGSREALGVDLPSYPETTALALLGLQGSAPADFHVPQGRTESRLADAWLAIAMKTLGKPHNVEPLATPPADLMIVALEALASPGGNAGLFRAEAA